MNKELKKFWNDPVGSKVISAGIIALLLAVYGFAANAFSWWPFPRFAERVITAMTGAVATPVWLVVLLSAFAIGFIVILVIRYLPRDEPLTEFYAISDLAKELGVSEEKIYQWGITGKLMFAFIRHEPSDYEDVSYEKDKKGREIKVTRGKTTMFSFSSKARPPIDIAYLKLEDTARVVLNETENRSILIHKLYDTKELLPERGRMLLNCPVSVKKGDLIIARDELSRFNKKYRSILKREKRKASKTKADA